MKRILIPVWVLLFILTMTGCDDKPDARDNASSPPAASVEEGVPVRGMVTMVDLGADQCVPCKLMAPILVDLEKEYQGRAAIVFFDVWKNKAPAKKYGVRAIPTQIFFNADGKEVHRHVGFMSKEDIVAQLKHMGVE